MKSILVISALISLTACVPKADLIQAQKDKDIAVSDDRDCRANEHAMAESRQHDFTQWALKSDAEIKQTIFQQGFLCGQQVGSGRVSFVPRTYEDLPKCQKEVEEAIEKDKLTKPAFK